MTKDPEDSHPWHANTRIAAQFDLNDLKNPSLEYLALFYTTLLSHVGLLTASVICKEAWVAWAVHAALGITISWLGGFAHNGLHLYPRRILETFTMYLSMSNNPFRWTYLHIQEHHEYVNSKYDADKRIVREYQQWVREGDPKVAGILIGTVWVGWSGVLFSTADEAAPSMTQAELKLPMAFLSVVVALGVRGQGWKYVPRLILSFVICSVYTFIFFQASHYQPEILDGDVIRAETDDWAEYQLKTTWGWGLLNRPMFCLPWLFLNLQPQHHIFPAVHHSKLRLITPLIRAHYPGLLEDHSPLQLVIGMFRILFGFDCMQP
jgi:fatty acid desaturase